MTRKRPYRPKPPGSAAFRAAMDSLISRRRAEPMEALPPRKGGPLVTFSALPGLRSTEDDIDPARARAVDEIVARRRSA